MEAKDIIAKRVAQEFNDGDVVNLGIGIPTLAPKYIPENIRVTLHSENGMLGLGPPPSIIDKDIANAGGLPASIFPGGACFDSAMSFTIIRGGHLDISVLGALEVDEMGDIANWMVPGKMVPGMGGAMDLLVGSKKVIVAMEHTTKDGSAKILKKCTLPLTGKGVVDLIITNLCVFKCDSSGLLLTELAPGVTIDDVKNATQANFCVAEPVKVMLI